MRRNARWLLRPTRSLSDLGGRYEGKTGLSQILSGFEENSRSI